MTDRRSDRFVSRGFKGVTVIQGPGSGEPVLAARASARKAVEQGQNLRRKVAASPELQAIVGSDPLSRSEIVQKIWAHIRANNLQDPANKRQIITDSKLRRVVGKDRVGMFEMNKHLSRHIDERAHAADQWKQKA